MTDIFPYLNMENIDAGELNRLARLPVNAQTGTTYTLVVADEASFVTLNNAGSISLVFPQDSDVPIPVGGIVNFCQLGAGQVTASGGTGATVHGTPTLKSRTQYSTFSGFKYAANTWLITGDLAVV